MNADEDTLNPRYVAYARAHGRTPFEQEQFDLNGYPGGRMAGYIVWIGEQTRALAAKHPEAMRGGRGGQVIADQEAFDRWLAGGAA